MVIPQGISIREEGLPSILSGSQAELQLVTGGKLKTQIVPLRIAKVFTVVAFSFVKRLTERTLQRSMASSKQV